MKKLTKILSAVLLLSLVLSVFAVFSFGADTDGPAPVVVYDMEKKLGNEDGTINGSGKNVPKDVYDAEGNLLGKSVSMVRYETEAGDPYWQHKVLGALQDDGTYTVPHNSSNTYFQISPDSANTAIRDSRHGAKNTNYLVIDFDISTDGYTGGRVYFHTRWKDDDSDKSQANYLWLDGYTFDAFNVESRTSSAVDKGCSVTAAPTGDSNWVGVTVIYDFTSSDAADWIGHVYIDGVYGGDIKACKSTSAQMFWMRVSYKTSGLEHQELTANFANFTITSFPLDYQGDLATKADNLAKTAHTLSEFSDLAYTAESPAPLKVATVEREGNSWDVYHTDSLDASLLDGDKVTLHQELYKSIIIPEGANIEFDLNGHWMTAPTAVDYTKCHVVVRDLISDSILGYGASGATGDEGDDDSTATTTGISTLTPSVNMDSSSFKIGKVECVGGKKDTYDRPYWTMDFRKTTVAIGDSYFTSGPMPLVLKSVNNTDGSVVSTKDSEYLVLDFDMSTDTSFVDTLYLNMRWNKASANKYNVDSVSAGGTNAAISVVDGKLTISDDNNKTVTRGEGKTQSVSYDAFDPTKWTHVTIVYDFSAESNTDWHCYVYADGNYIGDIGYFKSTVAKLYFIRFTVKQPTAADATTNMANFTFKRFSTDYTGNMGELLGKSDVNLSAINDLAYCMENDMNNPHVVDEVLPTVEEAIKAQNGKDIKVTLLNNAEMISTDAYVVSDSIVLDLNGHTLTTDSTKSSAHNFQTSSNLIIKNGKLNFKTSYATNLVMMANANANVIIKDIELTMGAKNPLVEQRAGRIVIDNVKCDKANNAIVGMRGGNSYLTLDIIDSEIHAESNAFYVANTSSGSKRYGSLNNVITLKNSTITTKGDFIFVQSYASEQGSVSNGVFTPSAVHGDNNNLVSVTVDGGSVKAGGAFINNKLMDLRNDMHDVDADGTNDVLWADNFKANVVVTVNGTDIGAKNLVTHDIYDRSDGVGYLPDDVVASGVTLVHHTELTLNNTKIDLVDEAMTSRSSLDTFGTVNITINGETPLSTSKAAIDDDKVTLNTEKGLHLVPRSAPGESAYALTANVSAYPYIVGGEEYEFLWYAGDLVTIEKIPVELPNTSKYVKFEWAPETDINGAYYTIMKVDLPVKANLSLYTDFSFNLYLPTDLGDEAYNNVYVNGAKVPVYRVTGTDGVDYMMVKIENLSPAVAAEKLSVDLSIFTDDTNSIDVKKEVSVLGYISSILESNTAPAGDKKLAASLLNYIDKAYKLEGKSNEDLAALTASAEYTAITLEKTTDPAPLMTVSDLGIFSEVGLTLAGDFRYVFKTADDFEGNIIVTYYQAGKKVMKTFKMKGGAELVLDIKAQDLLEDITFRYAGVNGSFNLAAYLKKVESMEGVDQKVLDLIDALWIYSECANAFKAN